MTRTSTQRYESGAEPDRPDQRVTREGRAERRERERRRERLEREGMWQVVSSCAKKRRYVTYDQARAVVRHREREGGEPLFIYRCEHCGGWHITHQADQQRYGREAGRAAEERLARQAAQEAVEPAPRFAVDDLVIDVASGMPRRCRGRARRRARLRALRRRWRLRAWLGPRVRRVGGVTFLLLAALSLL